jgi:cell division protein FtsZ
MVASGITGAYFVAVNTDMQDLIASNADEVIQIGKQLTKGLGAGSNPDVGKAAAEESIDDLRKMLEGTNLLFITTGLGGGTGNGAAPVIARLAKEMGILTIGVVTKPFKFEGPRRAQNAERGIEEMRKYVDSLVIIPNEKLYKIFNKEVSLADAFRYADDVLHQAIQGVSEVISVTGLINLDFADVATIMRDKGIAHMGIGKGRGANKTIEAVRQAVTSQLLETSIEGATGILINISGGRDLTLSEVYEAVDLVRDVAHADCNVIFGANVNNDISGETEVTVIATGFEHKDTPKEQVPEFKDNSADFKTFTYTPVEKMSIDEVMPQQEVQPEQPKEEKVEIKEEKVEEPEQKDEVEDISIASKKPIIDDDDIPPFLRKLRR